MICCRSLRMSAASSRRAPVRRPLMGDGNAKDERTNRVAAGRRHRPRSGSRGRAGAHPDRRKIQPSVFARHAASWRRGPSRRVAAASTGHNRRGQIRRRRVARRRWRSGLRRPASARAARSRTSRYPPGARPLREPSTRARVAGPRGIGAVEAVRSGRHGPGCGSRADGRLVLRPAARHRGRRLGGRQHDALHETRS